MVFDFFKNKKNIIFLLVVLLLTSFFRIWKLDSIPPGLYPDVAINGNDALDSLETGKFKLFYPENNGREGLFMWLIAFSFSIFGPSVWAIKIVPAVIGIFTVLGLYLLTKELIKLTETRSLLATETGSLSIALLSSFFLAVSFWHVNFSRLGFRAIMVPFFLVFGFYFLFKGFRNKKILNLIISGVFFGLGFYTYISYRFVVFLLTGFLLYWLIINRKKKDFKKLLFSVFYLLLSVFLVALPVGIYFLFNLGDFFGRAVGVSIFNSGKPIYELAKSAIVHLGMFNFYGDINWRHNFSGSPQLLWPVGIFFLIGIILSIKNKNWFLISWFLIMLLPGILTCEGIPHALRTIGAIPPVFIFAGIGANWLLFEKIKKFFQTKKLCPLYYIYLFVLLFSIAFAEFDKYFYQWPQKQETKDAFSENLVQVGNYLNSLPDNLQKYVIVNLSGVTVNGIPMPAQTPIFIERTKYSEPRAVYLLPNEINKIKINENTVIIPLQ